MKEGELVAVNGLSGFTNRFRLSGLASGLDTDQLVLDLMRVERMPLDKVKQKKQIAEWKRDDYREITNLLRSFKDEFFDVLKPASNMLSRSAFSKYSVVSTDENVITASGAANAVQGVYKVKVNKLATADEAASTSGVTKFIRSSGNMTDEDGKAEFLASLEGKRFNITLNGVTKEIVIGKNAMISDLAADIQGQIDKAFGSGKITVNNSVDGEWYKLNFLEADTSVGRFTLSSAKENDALSALKINSGASNRINTDLTLKDVASSFSTPLTFVLGEIEFEINGKKFTFKEDQTLSSMMNTINSDADANVNISYDEITDKFNIVSKQLGEGDNIRISQKKGNFFDGASKISTGSPITKQGQDAEVVINGELVRRGSNTVTVNGVNFNLLSESETEQKITISPDVDEVYNTIKSFVDKYNEVISKINEKLGEDYDRNYAPLTDEQKEEMSEDDVKKWEEKAKTGLLRNDQLLQDIVYSMRNAVIASVEGVSINLTSIGINTTNYQDKGKLEINETKLKNAIKNDLDSVIKLFTKTSSITSDIDLDPSQKTQRYREEGVAYKLFDIIENNIRTRRDANDNKGILLEKAGITGDASEYENMIYNQISSYEDRIEEFLYKLTEKENYYYKRFTAMEQAISQMNAQSSWLITQFNSGN
jgi:flagellar hook-associated protein 2